jgi:NUMOD4 motif/HNH endonuclease/Sigma-70, region 4
MERWKSIEGFEGLYEVSDEGRVRSLPRVVPFRVYFFRSVRGGPKALTLDKDGYLAVSLSKLGVPYVRKVHRLVADAFLERSEFDEDVNHKDACKTNNHWRNLEWCTHKENGEHAALTDLMAFGSRHGMAKLTEADIPVIRQLFYRGWTYRSIAENYEVSQATVSDVIRGKTWVRV